MKKKPQKAKWMYSNTYDFLVVNFQATNNQVHGLLSFTILLISLDISGMWLIRSTLEVKGRRVAIDNLEHGHVLRKLLLGIALFLEALCVIVAVEGQVVA